MKIVRKLKMNNFLVRWHLDMLLKFNLIKNKRIGNFEIYYDVSIGPEEARLNHLISLDKCAKIINYLKANEDGSTKYQLTKNLRMHPNTITKYLDRLDEFGLLFKENLKNKTLYFFDEKLLV